MRSFITLGAISLVGAAALFACGDDDNDTPLPSVGGSGGSAGSGGGAGSGGTSGSGGSGGTGGISGSGGGGGTGGGGQGAAPCVGALEGGCARISIPAEATANADFEIDLGVAGVSMAETTLTFRVKASAATGGALQVYIKNGAAQNYAGYYTAFRTLATTTAWTDVVVNLAPCNLPAGGAGDAGVVEADAGDAGGGVQCPPPPDANAFDKRAVRFVGIQILPPAAAPRPAVTVDVDSIKFSVHPPADITFATTVEGLVANAGNPTQPVGSTATFAPGN
jgi:hypothetical protein